MINDPMYIESSDHPGIVLTNTPFNGTNFYGWNRNVRMALGAKLKLGFIDGSCPKPGVEHVDLQRWIRKDNRGSRNEGKNDGKRFCTGCNQEGHTVDQCFEKIRYPDWYKGKKAKKQGKIAANVNSGFDDHFSADTPFDMGYENEIGTNPRGGVDHRQPKVVRSDNRTEIVNKTCASFFQAHGVLHQRSIAHTPQQNRRVESKHRHDLILLEHLDFMPPTYDHLRVIGCLCYAADVRPHKDKFANRGIKSVLIGSPVNQKGYKLYNWETKEVFLSRYVVFEENSFPFKEFKVLTNPQSTPTYLTFETHDEETTEPVNPNTPLSAEPNISDAITDNFPSSNHVSVSSTPSIPLRKSSRNSTRPAW
nr:putative polyprotein [Tanacetum cinerariifolium]